MDQMKVLLINPRKPPSIGSLQKTCRLVGRKTFLPPLGLITVAALLPPQWDLRLVDLDAGRLTEADWSWADMVMVSGIIVQRDSLLALVREARQRGKIVVAGGIYPSTFPHEVLEAGCDFLFRGESENTFPLWLTALREGKSSGIFESSELPDVATSPIPRFDLLNLSNYLNLMIQTSRGCPYGCDFCEVSAFYGRKPRYKEPSQVLAELEVIYELGWRRDIFVCDDNFIGNKARAREILKELSPWNKSHGEPFSFWTQVSVNLGQDKELIDVMTAANFSMVFIGIESPDTEVLSGSGKYQNIRNPLADSLNNIAANGLSILGSFMLGLDAEKSGAGERICAFVESTNIPVFQLVVLQVAPGTGLWTRLENEGRLLQDHTRTDWVAMRPNYVPARPALEILEDFICSWDYLFEPGRFLARVYRHCLSIRPTRSAIAKKKGEVLPLGPPRSEPPLGDVLRTATALLRLCWRHGIRSPNRRQYWEQFFGMLKHNPSRFTRYIQLCAIGEHMIEVRNTILRTAQR